MKKLFLGLIIFSSLFLAKPVLAACTADNAYVKGVPNIWCKPNKLDKDNLTFSSVPELLENVMFLLLFLSGVVATGALVFGGFLYMFSMGNPQNQERAINVLSYAGLGFVIIVTSYSIVSFVAATSMDAAKHDLIEFLNTIFKAALSLGGAALLFLLVYGGIKYITSAGNPEAVKTATNQIISAVIGLLIVVSSWATVTYVAQKLGIETAGPPSTPVSIKIYPPSNQTIYIGHTIQFVAEGKDEDGNNIPGLKFTWTDTDSSGLFTGTKEGVYEVRASSGSKHSNTVKVTVKKPPIPPPPALVSIKIYPPSNQTIYIGHTIQFVAEGKDEDGNNIPGLKFTWTDTDSSGLFTGTKEGVYEVRASSGSKHSNTVKVTVKKPPETSED